LEQQVAKSNTREYQRAREKAYRERLKKDPARLARLRANERAWRKSDKARNNRYQQVKVAKYRVNKPWYLAFKAAVRRARKFGLDFSITMDWAESQFKLGSALSGLPFMGENEPFAPSIDRIDSAKGYTPENSRMLLRAENLFKNEWSDEVVIQIAKAIVERNQRV
jgi:hypothetical protein